MKKSMVEKVAPGTDEARAGTGNWDAFSLPIERVFEAAAGWSRELAGVEKPWLCWNVSPRWCLLQQHLVQEAGWTPVVGFDPRAGPPPLVPGAILIDFNRDFQFSVMWLHFPLEFAFLFAPRLAFWHADLLCRLPVMQKLAELFASLPDGATAAALDRGGRRNWLNFRSHRYWEVCGCTTRSASENQFYNGAGWWRHIDRHIKCVVPEERARRRRYSYDSGVGILYWQRFYRGRVTPIDVRLLKEGHCSEIGNPNYQAEPGVHTTALRNLSHELDANYSLEEVAERLGIAHLL